MLHAPCTMLLFHLGRSKGDLETSWDMSDLTSKGRVRGVDKVGASVV